uniref:Ovule protein n=1 Tax=Acrobeloides nanus TaxID=290746 RepID=A0A914CMA6_9BILA
MEEFDMINNLYNLLFEIQRFVIDLICLTPPWFLLFMSSTVRQRILGRTKKHTTKMVSKAEPSRMRTLSSNKIVDSGRI